MAETTTAAGGGGGGDVTYSQALAMCDQIVAAAEQEQAEAQKVQAAAEEQLARIEGYNFPAMIDGLESSGLDGETLGHAAETHEALQKVAAAAQAQVDHAAEQVQAAGEAQEAAQATRDALVRGHGQVAEAVQAQPVAMAEKSFYEE